MGDSLGIDLVFNTGSNINAVVIMASESLFRSIIPPGFSLINQNGHI